MCYNVTVSMSLRKAANVPCGCMSMHLKRAGARILLDHDPRDLLKTVFWAQFLGKNLGTQNHGLSGVIISIFGNFGRDYKTNT